METAIDEQIFEIMIRQRLLALLVISTSCFQASCDDDAHSQSWRALSRMRAEDYFVEPLQVKLANAVARGKSSHTGELINQGADVNAEGRDGMRPLFWALAKSSLRGFEILLQNGANPNVTAKGLVEDERPPSVMELAAIAENPEYLRLALKYRGDPNFMVGYGARTVLFEAILNNRTDNVRILAASGANLNHQDSFGSTPAMTAASIDNYDMVMLLLEAGADPKIRGRLGYDLARLMTKFGARAIARDDRQYQWYLKVVAEMRRRGLLE